MKMSKVYLLGVLFLLNVSFLLGQNDPFDGGDGTKNDPYLISTRVHLEELGNRLGDSHKETHYKLISDIDLSGAEWIPIGDSYVNSFRGKFHGNGKNLKNITIGDNTDGYQYSGLFGYIGDGAYIDSINIVNGTINGWKSTSTYGYTGGLVGKAENKNLNDSICVVGCTVNADIVSSGYSLSYTGGIIAHSYGYLRVDNCLNMGDISGKGSMGGIIGISMWNDKGTQIKLCKNYGNISGDHTSGGIIGAGINTDMDRCKNYGDINGNEQVGGIIGRSEREVLNNCENYGKLIIADGTLGGIVGKTIRGHIFDCRNFGTLEGKEGDVIIGGIVGYAYGNEYIRIENCYNENNIENDSDNSSLGGILGHGYGMITLTNCYAFVDILNDGDASNIGGVIGKLELTTTWVLNVDYIYAYGNINSTGTENYIGGLIGYIEEENAKITVQNTVSALNNINGNANNIHRIVGKVSSNNGTVLQNNYAYEEIKINNSIVSTGIGKNTEEGENMTREDLYNLNRYPYWHNLVWETRDDKVNLPYFTWQSAPVYLSNLTPYNVSLNVYNDTDSIRVYNKTAGQYLTTMEDVEKGNRELDLTSYEISKNDTLIFHSFEKNKIVSYPVYGVVEEIEVTGINLNKNTTIVSIGGNDELKATILPENASNKKVIWSSNDNSIAEVDQKGIITGVAVGVVDIIATTEDGGFTDNCAVTVQAEPVSVTGVFLNESSMTLVGNESGKLIATIEPSNAANKNINWSSSDENIVTVNDEGRIIGKGEGTATITVTTEDGNYSDDCVVTVDYIEVTDIFLSHESFILSIGKSMVIACGVLPLNATDQSVQWSNSNENVIDLDVTDMGNSYYAGEVTGLTEGTSTISVTTNDGNYTKNCVVTVIDGPIGVTGIDINKKTLSLLVYEWQYLSANISPFNADNKKVIWTSDNEDVVMVTQSGQVGAMSPGTAIITATTEDGGLTANCEVTVKEDYKEVTGIAFNKTTMVLNVSDNEKLAFTITPSDATNKNVSWSSSDGSVVSVDEEGVIEGLKEGSAIITVTTEDGGFTDQCEVTVRKTAIIVTGVSFDNNEITIMINEEETLIATISPSDATNKNSSWSSSDGSVVSVDEDGVIKGLKKGSAIVTVTTEDGEFTDQCEVAVTDKSSVDDINGNKIKVYPNPVKDVLYVESGLEIDIIYIYSVNGSLLIQASNSGNKIDLGDLVKGEYIIKIIISGEEMVYKIIKE